MRRWQQNGKAVVVMFDMNTQEDQQQWQYFQSKCIGVPASPPTFLAAAAPEKGLLIDTDTTTKRLRLSLPEAYYAITIDQMLCTLPDIDNKQLWYEFESECPLFPTNYVVYQHFRRLNWFLKSGLNYGAHYVLYRGAANEFHSEYIVYIDYTDGSDLSWHTIQALTRIAADVKKTVLICEVKESPLIATSEEEENTQLTYGTYRFHGRRFDLLATAIRFWDPSIVEAGDRSSYEFQTQMIMKKKKKNDKRARKSARR